MPTIMPRGDLVQKAAAFIAEERARNPQKNLHNLLDEAGMRFNLTPLDTAALEKIFKEEKKNS